MTGAADPLDAAGDAGRRLNLDDKVDGTHVDTQLEARGRHQSGKAAGLERILDQEALLLGDGAVVGTDQFLTRQPIDRRGQPFGEAPRVHKDDRRAVLANQLEDAWMDRRPDTAARSLLIGANHGGRPAINLGATFQIGHVVHRNFDGDLHRLHTTGIDDRHLAVGAAEESRGLG